jgi:glycosyltransferase involved in cell wall biosynthesis
MKILFLARPTLFSSSGGDTVQVVNTAKYLRKLGVEVDIVLSDQKNIEYSTYDLLHLFNIIDCEDHLGHVLKCKIPFVISTIYVDYSEFDRHYRKGLIGLLAKVFSQHFIEYIKTGAKYFLKGEKVSTYKYFLLGHKGSIKFLLKNASYLLPNSHSEYQRLYADFGIGVPYQVVVNAIDTNLFILDANDTQRSNTQVVCAARIEGIKNQKNLIRAVSGKSFQLKLIGRASENQQAYFNECVGEAGENIEFIPQISQSDLLNYYKKAKVHVLPSWFETTGLASLEAAAMGCNIVISDKGDVREYFGDLAYYCNPDKPETIALAIENALKDDVRNGLREKVINDYTWEKAAEQTFSAYKKIVQND